jgi:hypothetical protein
MIQLPVKKYGLWFRFVEPHDAEFILSLRTDPVLAKHLSPTKNDPEAQRTWIAEYKKREAQGQEYYFLLEDEQHEPQGVVRLYDIKDGEFNCGSWLVKPGADEFTAIKLDLFVAQFALDELKLDRCLFDVRKKNKKVVRYHRMFSEVTGEDELNYYMMTDKDAYSRKIDYLKKILETSL